MAKGTMPRKERGVYRRKGIVNYHWQLRVPKELQPLYPSRWAEQCSLGTSDLDEANEKARQLRVQWDATFKQQREQLRATAPEKVERITTEMAKALADAVKHTILDIDERVRTNPKQWAIGGGFRAQLRGMPEHLADTLSEVNREQLELLSVAVARNRLEEARPIMESAAAELGLALDEQTPGYVEALKVCLHALKDASTLRVQRDKGEMIATPPPASLKQIEAHKPRKLRDVFDRWKAKKKRSKDSVQAMERALKQFEQQTGNPPLGDITRDMGDAFGAWLQTQGLASKTAHDRITAVKTLIKYAHQDLEWLPRHPWAGIDIAHQIENPRHPWTDEELKAFFGLPLFQRYELPERSHWKNGRDAAYWIPILGLYTGARVGELAQLRVQDVKATYAGPFLSITDEAEGATVKTAAGIRSVPVHPELIRLGFMEYVEATKKASAVSLWPTYKPLKDEPGTYFSGWVNPFHREATGNPDAPVFHELRHTVRTALHRARVDLHAIDLIIGHENGTLSKVQKGYTRLTEEDLASAIRALKFPAVSLPKVYAAS
jgi:integrase